MADTFIQSSNPQKWIPKFPIDHNRLAALCFKETLLICLKNEIITQINSIGNCCISVERIGPQKHEFLINTKFCINTDDYFGGSKVVCSSTNKFNCLEEKRTEYVYHKGSLNEKTLFMGIQDNSYYVETSQTYQHNRFRNCKNLTYPQNIKLLSEGTNLLLMRYLTIINYNGTLTFQNIMIDGNITTCQYKCTPAEYMKLYKSHIKVYTIERVIETQNGNVESMKTYLTPKGKILEHNWLSKSYMLKSKSLENVNPMTEKLKIAIRNNYWAEDMEIFSKYLDEKCNEVTKFIEYLINHVEVKHLIADYTQTLLIVKPLHVVDFTIQFFKAFSVCPESQEFISTEQISKITIPTQQRHSKMCDFYPLCTSCRMASIYHS
ncbi:ciliogenesis-associated TTC17-interacting protein-like [Vespa velutina]|uniref:ciliogenesis-associated TTC17-interacting protein-like n=1 Tax=Vespa velutina TaxID=202808 RepID=UPI001FB36EEB|nr:ciliogenesis-associated TTC17-interacting protein-like [Vespa velutina]